MSKPATDARLKLALDGYNEISCNRISIDANFALAKPDEEFVSSFHVLCGPADGIKTRIDNRPPINLFTLAQNVVK